VGERPAQVRVMKARATRAVSCGHWVIRGERIVKLPGASGWICLPCRLAGQEDAGPREPEAAGG
jgi:hypothetical protein